MILTPDRAYRANGVNVKEYLLTEHNPNNIMMPTAKLPEKILGITVHNTGWINVSSSTTPAEQYTRATYNDQMKDVRVHFYVDDVCAWQNLPLSLSGWHAADGSGNGNSKTIAIEVIGDSAKAEANAVKLTAYLLKQYGLNADSNLFTHTHWLNVMDGKSGTIDYLNTADNPRKMCPIYILPHWSTFKNNVKNALGTSSSTSSSSTSSSTSTSELYRIRKTWADSSSQIGAYSSLENAEKACKTGYSVFDSKGNIVYTPSTSTTTSVAQTINVYYRTYTDGRWLPEVTNYNDTDGNGYAGIENKTIRGIAIKVDKGQLKYRVHVKGGGWLGWISDYDIDNWKTGCAGNKTIDIDAIQIDFSGVSGYTARYKVSTISTKSYLDWIEGYNTSNSMGYAGIFGRAIDKIQIEIIKK